ncbi:MAG: hypothetical protein L6W00_19060 [Lentisphaeria bacterium]|nr:MAG: hypothetical protein L6W00_19060 [Lentisphaeria bacterium]
MAVYCFPYNREGIMYRMENEFILLEIDEYGILQKLCNRKNGRNLIRPRRLFRLILGIPAVWSSMPFPSGGRKSNAKRSVSLCGFLP